MKSYTKPYVSRGFPWKRMKEGITGSISGIIIAKTRGEIYKNV